MKLILVNKTKWDTLQLRRLCEACMRESGYEDRDNQIIEIRHGRSKWYKYRGEAYLRKNEVIMWVPPPKQKKVIPEIGLTDVYSQFNRVEFSKVLIHELDHNAGLEHEDMIEVKDIDVSFIRDKFPVLSKEDTGRKGFEKQK